MDVLNTKERELQIIFLHFLHISKINRERNYVTRNGKMPKYSERNEKYTYNFGLALRKFIEGIGGSGKGSKPLQVERMKSTYNYTVSLKEKYIYRTNTFIDNILKRGLRSNFIPSDPVNFNYKNHELSFDTPYGRGLQSHRSRNQDLQYVYRFKTKESEQCFIQDFFTKFNKDTDNNLYGLNSVIQEKTVITKSIERLLAYCYHENILNRDIELVDRSQITPVETVVSISSIARKYVTGERVVRNFVDQFAEILRSSSGVEASALFIYAKSLQVEHSSIINQFTFDEIYNLPELES